MVVFILYHHRQFVSDRRQIPGGTREQILTNSYHTGTCQVLNRSHMINDRVRINNTRLCSCRIYFVAKVTKVATQIDTNATVIMLRRSDAVIIDQTDAALETMLSTFTHYILYISSFKVIQLNNIDKTFVLFQLLYTSFILKTFPIYSNRQRAR